MSKTSRVLSFRQRRPGRSAPLDPIEAARLAESVVDVDSASLTDETLAVLADADVLSAFCKRLRRDWNADPDKVATRATVAYRWLSTGGRKCGIFDEHDYFLGELALLAAGAYRLVGDGESAERWLDRADAGYRHTVNPGPMLAETGYIRLALAYDRRRYDYVLELLPSAERSFERLGMHRDLARARFLRAMTLKECGKKAEAFDGFKSLEAALTENGLDVALLGRTCIEVGAFEAAEGNLPAAIESYQRAVSLLSDSGNPAAVAHLRMTLGETLRNEGRSGEAEFAFREGLSVYSNLGMATSVAYGRVILGETLLFLGRPREAEWEILQALPTIEEQKMVPEGFAAVALLRESVKQRKADPKALRELREHLQKHN